VGDAVLAAGLVGDELDKGEVADARRGVRVQVGVVARLPDVAGSEGGDSGAEGVARDNDLVGRVGLLGLSDGVQSGRLDLVPGAIEARVDETALDQIAGALSKKDAVFCVSGGESD
jgi:hypothetical protein